MVINPRRVETYQTDVFELYKVHFYLMTKEVSVPTTTYFSKLHWIGENKQSVVKKIKVLIHTVTYDSSFFFGIRKPSLTFSLSL